MKRRDGSSRRQVLDIDNAPSSWKNKYQAIAERNVNGSGGSSDNASNPLSKLVGNYASESDDEDDNSKSKSSLDAKVEEFMKEVESTRTSDDASSISCAWQECYDEGTGYPYYWNMNTNEVTWEAPPELVAYQAAVAAKLAQTQAKVKAQAQQAQWAVEQAALGITPEYPQKRIPTAAPSHNKKPPKSSTVLAAPQLRNKKNRAANKPPSSESDDEKIEMITSWADEESEDEDDSNDKKSKVNDKNLSKEAMQPRPPPSGPSRALKSAKPAKPVSSVIFGPQLPSSLPDAQNIVSNKIKGRSRNGSIEEANEVESKVVQKLRRLKTESDVIVGTRERVPVRKPLNASGSGSPNDGVNVNSKSRQSDGVCDNEPVTEKSLLSKLNKQVKILKDLGGCVPLDVKDLLNSASKTSAGSAATSADSIIAMIEMEQPPDHKQDERLLSSLKAAERKVEIAVQKIQADKVVNGIDKPAARTQKPTSFALIAGYGDDSDQDETADSDTSVHSRELSDKPAKEGSLFPILAHEDSCKDSLKDDLHIKAGGKLTFAPESTVLAKVNSDISSKPTLVLDPSGPGQKRKKRLDIGPFHSQQLPSSSSAPSDFSEEASKSSQMVKIGGDGATSGTTSYTTVWSSSSTYASDPTANDRRGFGFQVAPSNEEEPSQPSKPIKKGKIQFIKAETMNKHQEQDDSLNVREGVKESDSKNTTSKSHEDGELHRSLSSLAQLVIAKLQFLSDGKEPVSPVQAMAIQIETLVSAWNAGALTNSFLQRWLQSTGAELVQLERAAAPQGWAVQWDREYKRYFYCNLATKDTQWDYPLAPGTDDGLDKAEEEREATEPGRPLQPQPPQPEPRAVTPPPDPDDEDAMELCTTPPPEEEVESEMLSRPSSPALIAPPSKRLKTEEENGDSNDTADDRPSYQPPLPSTPPPPLPSSPPPPPPPPETPPPPPPGTPPSPSQPSAASSTSSSSSSRPRQADHGEPLPPGVDGPDVPFVAVRPALPPAPLAIPVSVSADLSAHMATHGVGVLNPMQSVGPLHPGSVLGVPVLSGVAVGAMAMQYSGTVAVTSSYVAPPPTEAMLASFNHATAVDYMGYMGVYAGPAGPMSVTSVAAPPLTYTGPVPQVPALTPAHMPQRKKEALMSELNSFYSDIASLDSNSRDATEDDTSQDASAVEPSYVKSSTPPVPLVPVAHPSSEETSRHQQHSDAPIFSVAPKAPTSTQETLENISTKKKKKTKLAPGLTLKKKGVSNLVAKWQQVQQEVWKDYQEEEDVE